MSKIKEKGLTIIFGIVLVFSSILIIQYFLNSENATSNYNGIVSTNNHIGILQSVTVSNINNITITGDSNFTNTAITEG